MQVGLDINVVSHSTWQAAPLQFVAGLGPRKAQLLSRAVQREEFVQSRSDLYKGLGVLGKHVFRRALRLGPFLVVAARRLQQSTQPCAFYTSLFPAQAIILSVLSAN